MKTILPFIKKCSLSLVLSIVLITSITTTLVSAQSASQNSLQEICNNAKSTSTDSTKVPAACQKYEVVCVSAQDKTTKVECKAPGNPIITTILKAVQLLDFFIGIAAVIIIIIAGFRYVLSRGDSGQVETAKNTILYALVGVAVAIVAQAVIVFVLNRI